MKKISLLLAIVFVLMLTGICWGQEEAARCREYHHQLTLTQGEVDTIAGIMNGMHGVEAFAVDNSRIYVEAGFYYSYDAEVAVVRFLVGLEVKPVYPINVPCRP